MALSDLLALQEKLENAVAFGINAKENLQWAKAQLDAVNARLANV